MEICLKSDSLGMTLHLCFERSVLMWKYYILLFYLFICRVESTSIKLVLLIGNFIVC